MHPNFSKRVRMCNKLLVLFTDNKQIRHNNTCRAFNDNLGKGSEILNKIHRFLHNQEEHVNAIWQIINLQ